MATASITASTATTKSKRPDAQRVYETFLYEVKSSGEWGAYARTAARYHKPDGSTYSDEWARKTIKQHLARVAEQEAQHAATPPPVVPDELRYLLPPDGYPTPTAAAPDVILSRLQAAKLPTSALNLPTLEREPPTLATQSPTKGDDIIAAVNGGGANCQPATDANSQPIEREVSPIGNTPNSQPPTLQPRPRDYTLPVLPDVPHIAAQRRQDATRPAQQDRSPCTLPSIEAFAHPWVAVVVVVCLILLVELARR
jgi:hypothetical protein